MSSPSAPRVPGARRIALALIATVLIVAGLGAVLATGGVRDCLSGSPGVALASSPPFLSASAPGWTQLDILLAQFSDAWRANDWPSSMAALTAILAIDPANSQMRERLCQAHLNLGWQLLAERSLVAARQEFLAAQQLSPGSVEARDGLRLLERLAGGTLPPSAPTVTPIVQPAAQQVAQPQVSQQVVQPQVSQQVVQAQVLSAPAATAAVPACATSQPAAPTSFVCHVVRTGDTLFGLARQFGTTVEAIVAANSLRSCTIFVCQKLLIPVCGTTPVCPTVCAPVCPTPCPLVCPAVSVPAAVCAPVCPTPCPPVCAQPCAPARVPGCPTGAAVIHVVQRGDDLFRLSIRFHVSLARLMHLNCLTTTSLRVGQVLIIA